MRVQKREQARAAARSQARPSEAHPWRFGCLSEKRELARIEAARAARISAHLERVAVEVSKAEAVTVEDVGSLVAAVVRSAAGPRRLADDE